MIFIGKKAAAGGGASGNFTFVTQASDTNYGDANITMSVQYSSQVAGDLIVIMHQDRSGTAHSNHTCSFTGTVGGTVTKRGGLDNEIGDTNARTSLSVWTYEVQSGDSLTLLQADDGTSNSKRTSYFVIRPSASYGAVFKELKLTGSGTGDWNNLDSGNTASLTGDDLLEIALAGCRNSTDPPTATNTSFDNHTTGHTEQLGGNNQVSHVLAMKSPSTGEGVKSSNVNSNGSGNEGICGILVFGDT